MYMIHTHILHKPLKTSRSLHAFYIYHQHLSQCMSENKCMVNIQRALLISVGSVNSPAVVQYGPQCINIKNILKTAS